jgi:peptide/nickel transport system substrate-binding protein
MREEFEPGHKAVYLRNRDYVPRSEPPDWASGGKVVKLDRVEWLVVAEPSTAAAALGDGEVDWWENPSPDLARVLAANPDITVEDTDPLGSMGLLRFNQLLPPFDNVKMRQAVLAVFDQADFLTALAGAPKDWKRCASFFTCGTPMASDAGSVALTGKRDFDAAKRLIAEAGYKGEKIVVLDAVDLLTNHIHALVTTELFKKLGLNVELATSDWGTVVTRRASKKPIAEGGWNVFGTDFEGPRCSTRGSTRRSLPTAKRRGSVGQRTTKSKHYEASGSRPATARRARRLPVRSRNAPLKLFRTSRPDNISRRPPIVRT